MAEPSTTALTVASAGIGFASLFPGIDGNALIGAFAGAALVVVTSRELSTLMRFAYLLISLVAGYLAAEDVVRVTPIASTGMAAFFAAALAIAVTLPLIERVKALDLLSFWRKR
jgi:hypothetical protein